MLKIHLLVTKKAVLIGSVFLLFFATGAMGATYYVATTGSDSNRGTAASPWRTIQYAENHVSAGDTVIVKDGTYTSSNSAVVTVNCAGASGNWITFKAEKKWGAVIDGKNVTGSTGIKFTSGARYVRIEGFEIVRAQAGIGCTVNSYVDHVYIYNNKIHNIGRWRLSTCETSSCPCGIGTHYTSTNITIDSNAIYDIGRDPNPSCNGSDLHRDQTLYLQGKYIVVKNNIIYNNHAGYCIKIDGHYDPIPSGDSTHKIINNTFAFDANPSTTSGISHIIFSVNAGSNPRNVIIQNNIFYKPPNGRAIYSGKWYSGTSIMNNISTAAIHTLGTNPPTYSGNQSYTDTKLTDVIGDEFENLDFGLQSTSPAIDAGLSSGTPDFDFASTARPQGSAYDLGAYEYKPKNVLTSPRALRIEPLS